MTYGTITKTVATNQFGTGSVHGPVPPNGESDQRQADDSIVAAPPTPKAPNRAGETAAPGMPGAPPFAGVSVARRTAKVDRRERARVRLRCPAGTNGSCRGRLTLTVTHGRTTLGRADFDIAAAKELTVKVKLSRAARSQLRRHRRLAARARATAHDAAGASMTTSARLTLIARRRPARRV
jgi:hypothetical protein